MRWLAILVAPISVAAFAEQAIRLDRIEVVAASRVEEPAETVPASVSVIRRDELFESLAFDLRSALRYEPGVSIESNAARFGLGNVSIRGLDGNRVQMTLDGIRLPESYRVGSFSNASRNALGLGLLRRIELVRGPASAIHGSDALAGVLAFTTVEPADYLHGKAWGGEAFANAAEADRSLGGGAIAAVQAGSNRLLAGYERRDGHEVANRGDVAGTGAERTQPNPQDTLSESVLFKWHAPLSSAWSAGMTLDRFARHARTDVLSLNPQSSRTVSLAGDDRLRRTRASFDLTGYDTGPFERIKLTAYSQESKTSQDTDEVRANTTAACLSAIGAISCERQVTFHFDQRENGIVAIGQSERRHGAVTHRIVSGAEFSRLRSEERREGVQANLATGATANVVGGELLPTRDFPLTTTDRFGIFVQDRIDAQSSALTWIPGIRLDRFRLEPEADELFRVNRPVVSLADSAWSPRLGALWRMSRAWTLTAQVSTGFRAPPASDLNIGLSSLPAGFAVIGNPELKPESSRGAELGARFAGNALEISATAFQTRYRDLILSRAALSCPSDPRCVPGATGTFQSQNVSAARIRGIEINGRWRIARGWLAQAAYASLRGDDLDKRVPLNSIDPPRLVAGIEWDREALGAAIHVTHSAKVTRYDPSTGIRFVPPSWTTVDLTARASLGRIEMTAGIFNVFDRKYWLWSDVRGLTNIPTGFDRYTQPGRSVGVALRAQL